MIEGYTPVPIEHFGGLICNWPPEMLDVSLAVEAVNLRFTEAEVGSREGLTMAFQTPNAAAITGLLDYLQLDGSEQPLVFDASGRLYVETPAGSGHLGVAGPGSAYAPPVGAWMNGAATYNRAYLAFGDGKQGLAPPASFDGTALDPVTLAGPPGGASAADGIGAGNIAGGARWGVVLYQTREGSLTAPQQLPFGWNAAGGKQVAVSNLPTGPEQVAARVVAFTVAGGSSAGPFYYIGLPQTVNGVEETSTIVPDNTSTSATFNFDDAFLAASVDATDQTRAMVLPNLAGVAYSETTDRMMWWGDPAQPSVVYCSQPADPGVYFGDTGFFEVANNNGQRVTAVFEFRDQVYVAKQDGIHLVTPNDGDPATWDVHEVVHGIGACSARAAAVGNGYALLVHRTGIYQFAGGTPVSLSDELCGPAPNRPGLWERINWAYDHLIWVSIDHEAKCARVGVPLDGATMCSHILKLSYLEGWGKSIRFSPFTARYHYFPGRRWSVDTIAATQAVRVKRPLALPGAPVDRRLGQSQMLLGSAAANGAVYFPDPGASTDDGRPFAWALHTGAISAAELLQQQRRGMELVGLIQVRAQGQGKARLATVADGGAPRLCLTLPLADRPRGDCSGLALAQGEAVGLRLTGGDDGAPATLRLAAIYAMAKPTWPMRPY